MMTNSVLADDLELNSTIVNVILEDWRRVSFLKLDTKLDSA
jgi:hypothetical protein